MNTYCIYAIVHKITGDAYVGSSRRTGRRWQEHQWKLQGGIHNSKKLQEAWDRDGPAAFEFVTLWLIFDGTPSIVKLSEIYWITKIGAYNDMQADMASGKFVMPDEARERLGKQNRDRMQLPEYREGMSKHSKRRWADPELRKALMNAPTRGRAWRRSKLLSNGSSIRPR
jgi:hypothetical protein